MYGDSEVVPETNRSEKEDRGEKQITRHTQLEQTEGDEQINDDEKQKNGEGQNERNDCDQPAKNQDPKGMNKSSYCENNLPK